MLEPYVVPRVNGPFEVEDEFPLRGSCNPERVIDFEGRRWVRKEQRRGLGFQLAGEIVGALLGTALKVPIPEFAVVDRPPGWLSRFVPASSPWSILFAASVANEADLGRMLALDAIILNTDRKADNIVLSIEPATTEWKGWAIDHGGAVVSYPSLFEQRQEEILDPGVLPHDFPVRRLRRSAMACAEDAENLSSWAIEQICAEACQLSGTLWERTMMNVLSYRCRHASRFVEGYLDALEARCA